MLSITRLDTLVTETSVKLSFNAFTGARISLEFRLAPIGFYQVVAYETLDFANM